MKKLLLFLFAGALLSATAHAQLVVNDPINLVENIAQVEQAVQQNVQLAQHYTQMIVDYKQAVKHFEAMVDVRGMSLVNNGTYEQQFIRRYMPADFDQAMNMRYNTGGGSAGTSVFQNYLNQLVSRYALPEVSPAFQTSLGVTQTTRNIYDDRLRASQATMAATRTASANTEARISSVEQILNQADASIGQANDLKRSLDLNTRMAAENAFLQAEIIRLLSQSANLTSLQDQEDLSRQARRQQVLSYRGGNP